MSYTHEGFIEGERIARISVWTLAALGLVEIIIGQVTGSIGLAADGIDSFSDAFISAVVWLGLKTSRKAPDERFHFGYYKVESFVSFVASIAMIVIGALIFYRSYFAFLDPHPLSLPILALGTLLVAGTVSLYRALQMRRIAKKYGLLSLDLDAKNAIKDGTASYMVFFTVLASSLGFHQMDAVGGMLVAGYIFTVSYVILKESSLILLDAFHSPELVAEIEKLVRTTEEVQSIHDVKLRRLGPLIKAEILIAVDGKMSVSSMYNVINEVKTSMRKNILGMGTIVVRVVPAGIDPDAEKKR